MQIGFGIAGVAHCDYGIPLELCWKREFALLVGFNAEVVTGRVVRGSYVVNLLRLGCKVNFGALCRLSIRIDHTATSGWSWLQ